MFGPLVCHNKNIHDDFVCCAHLNYYHDYMQTKWINIHAHNHPNVKF